MATILCLHDDLVTAEAFAALVARDTSHHTVAAAPPLEVEHLSPTPDMVMVLLVLPADPRAEFPTIAGSKSFTTAAHDPRITRYPLIVTWLPPKEDAEWTSALARVATLAPVLDSIPTG